MRSSTLVEIVSSATSCLIGLVAGVSLLAVNSHPEFSLIPMPINSAIGFIICGISLFGIAVGRRLFGLLAVIPAALGLGTLIEYISKQNFGIDGLFLQIDVTQYSCHLLRMSPHASFCLMLSGLAIALMPVVFRQRYFVCGLLGAIVFAKAMVAYFGVLSGVRAAYAWGHMPIMPWYTSLSLILLASGIIAFAWSDHQGRCKRNLWFWPVMIAVSIVVADLCFWQGLRLEHRDLIKQLINQRLTIITNQVKANSQTAIGQREEIKGDWQSLFARVIDDESKNNYSIAVWQGAIPVFTIGQADQANDKQWSSRAYVASADGNLQIVITPHKKYLIALGESVPEAVLILGLLGALSLALMVYLAETLLIRAKETEEINKQLKSAQSLSTQTEKTLRDAQRKTRLIIDKAYEGFIAVNPDGVIVEWNHQAEKIFGWSHDEAIGQNITKTISHPKYRSMLGHDLKDISDTGRRRLSNIRTEITALHKDGHEFPVEVAFFTVQIDDKVTFCAFLHDISERTRLNQQREDFVATLAHDLKTPLLGANRLLEHLIQGRLAVPSDEQKDVIGKLLKSNENMLELIGTLLDVYRYEQGSKPLDFQEVELSPLIKECIDQLRPLIEAINLNLSFAADSSVGMVKADATELKRCFQNILSNSIKFTPPGGRIEIVARKKDNSVVIEFKDTGIGIAAEDLSKLFQRFWQGEPGRKYPSSTGLGLFLCHMIVDAHGGTITCNSEVDSGTIFSVTLPIAKRVRVLKLDQARGE